MQIKLSAVLIIGCAILLISCNRNPEESTSGCSNSIDSLAMEIHLDPKPLSASWAIRRRGKDDGSTPGPVEHYLIAAVKYDSLVFETFTDSLKQYAISDSCKYFDSSLIEQWLPEEVLTTCVKDGESIKMTAPFYRGTQFFNPPYSNGYIAILNNRTVFIVLFSM